MLLLSSLKCLVVIVEASERFVGCSNDWSRERRQKKKERREKRNMVKRERKEEKVKTGRKTE